jgi:branched-chain amino acid transport system substrate-binding protein
LDGLPPGLKIEPQIIDTGATPEGAIVAFERALDGAKPLAIVAPILGTQMLALLPLAQQRGVPLLTISGTAKLTEMGNPWIFRYFPGDQVVKIAQARYAVEKLGIKKPALLFQTTAYGQSGREHLADQFAKLGAPLVFEEGLAPTVKDFSATLAKAKAAGADALILQLHAGPAALLIGQARGLGIDLPIVAGSAMHQPATAALLSPAELRNVCAETASSPISGGSAAIDAFATSFRARFGSEPDAFALAQYDAVRHLIAVIQAGAKDGEAVRKALAATTHDGLAMRYRSSGAGDMAHDAAIICFDGTSRRPAIVARYAPRPN